MYYLNYSTQEFSHDNPEIGPGVSQANEYQALFFELFK